MVGSAEAGVARSELKEKMVERQSVGWRGGRRGLRLKLAALEVDLVSGRRSGEQNCSRGVLI